ncbi:MAG: hypothetical protein Q9213_005084 [Squamulea squamosa]
MSHFPGQQHALRGQLEQQSFALGQSSSSRYPNSTLRRDASSDWSQPTTPARRRIGSAQQHTSLTPSPRAYRELAEQPAYQAMSSISRHGSQPQHRSGQVAETRSRPHHPSDGLPAARDSQQGNVDHMKELQELRRKYDDTKIHYWASVRQREQYVNERDQYQQQAEEQTKRCQALEEEVKQLKRQMKTEEKRHLALEQDYEQMFEELNRARSTIKLQSEKIEGRVDTTLVKTTKDMAIRQKQPPPPPASRFGEDYGFGLKPFAPRRSEDRYDPRESLYEGPHDRRQNIGTLAANLTTSTALTIRPQQDKREIPWASEFSSLFLRIEQYCKTYLDLANENADDEWPQRLAYDVVQESSVNHVTQIGEDHQVRHLLLARVIIGWIANHYFHSRIIKGFSQETDKKVQDTRRQTRADNSIDCVRALAHAEAKTIEGITQAPGFDSWRASQIHRDVNTMVSRLREAIVPGATSAPLGKALESILADGWRVGLLMATCTDQFAINFPTATPQTIFDPRVMLNRDPYITAPPTEVEKWGARVALGITPHITVKSLQTAKMEERSVHMANVLLRFD